MTDAKPDLQPNERKTLDSLLALGEATAAKVGEHAGLAYSTTTPKLRKLETLDLAERFRNDAGQTLWRATAAATGREAPGATLPVADQPAHPDESDAADTDDAAPIEDAAQPSQNATPTTPVPAVPDTGTTITPSSTTSAPVRRAEPGTAQSQTPESQTPEGETPDAAVSEEPGHGTPHDDTPTGEGPAPAGGDDTTAEDAVAPAEAPAVKPTPKRKRPAGALEASVLAILRADPHGTYKVNDLRKAVDKADEATGYPAASAGAIANALDKLTGKGQAVTVEAKHATFQAAPAS